jgi:hypothetical protein
MTVLAPGASIFVKAFRISALTENGNVAAGGTTVTTKDGMKLTITPTLQTGADIVALNANDEIAAMARAGDKIKYYTIALELAKPDPQIEQLFCGGTMLGSSAAALGEPAAQEVKPLTTGGTLAKGFYGYRVSQYNVFGESKATAEVLSAEATNATAENSVYVVVGAMNAAASGSKVYGRIAGKTQFLGKVPNIATPKLETAIAAKALKKGVPTIIKVEAASVTRGIPAGTTLIVKGDTSAPISILEVQGYVEAGAATMTVVLINTAENSAKIEPEKLQAVFFDTGALTPEGNLPETDTTAGPGENIGYAAPGLGYVAAPNGVAVEAWSYCYIEGAPATLDPYWWWVLPRVRFGHIQPRDLSNANAQTIMEGIGIGNEHFGSGPTGEWPSAIAPANKAWQRIRCGAAVVPTPSYEPQLATV